MSIHAELIPPPFIITVYNACSSLWLNIKRYTALLNICLAHRFFLFSCSLSRSWHNSISTWTLFITPCRYYGLVSDEYLTCSTILSSIQRLFPLSGTCFKVTFSKLKSIYTICNPSKSFATGAYDGHMLCSIERVSLNTPRILHDKSVE